MLITRSGQPLTFKNFRQHREELLNPPQPADLYESDFTVVYGLYSRHGMFHGLPLPSPEFNIRELSYNFQ